MIATISEDGSGPSPKEQMRAEIEKHYGKVWETTEMMKEFEVHSFQAPFAIVTRRADGVKGSLEFVHMPRFYFNFIPA